MAQSSEMKYVYLNHLELVIIQGGTKLMVQSYVAICFIIFAPPCRSIPKLTVAQPCIFLENEAFHYSDRI